MAYYAYKQVRDLIPKSWATQWEEKFKKENDIESDGDAGYDGDLWRQTADYIRFLRDEDPNKVVITRAEAERIVASMLAVEIDPESGETWREFWTLRDLLKGRLS